MTNDLDPKQAKVFQTIRRMVLWDEPEENITRVFEVNGTPAELSSRMLATARAERIADLRSAALRPVLAGAGMMLLGLVLFFGVALATGYTTRGIFVISGLLLLFGASLFAKGIVNFLSAPWKKGSVAHEN